jgi:hypothetical protein
MLPAVIEFVVDGRNTPGSRNALQTDKIDSTRVRKIKKGKEFNTLTIHLPTSL